MDGNRDSTVLRGGLIVDGTGGSPWVGDVLLRGGEDGTLMVQGEIDASDAEGQGGRIRVLGDRIALVGARLDASGVTAGREYLDGLVDSWLAELAETLAETPRDPDPRFVRGVLLRRD